MPDRHGGSTRFKSATDINHSRTREPASGIPRNPGRPQGRQDAMPRNRGDSPQKTGVPGWAKALLKPQQPDWALREAGAHHEAPEATPQQQLGTPQQLGQQVAAQPSTEMPPQDPYYEQMQHQAALRKRLAMLLGRRSQ